MNGRLRRYGRLGGATEFLWLFAMSPTLALMKTEANCSLRLKAGTRRTNNTSKRYLVRAITYLLVGTVLRSFQSCRPIVTVCIRNCHLGGASMSAVVFF